MIKNKSIQLVGLSDLAVSILIFRKQIQFHQLIWTPLKDFFFFSKTSL